MSDWDLKEKIQENKNEIENNENIISKLKGVGLTHYFQEENKKRKKENTEMRTALKEFKQFELKSGLVIGANVLVNANEGIKIPGTVRKVFEFTARVDFGNFGLLEISFDKIEKQKGICGTCDLTSNDKKYCYSCLNRKINIKYNDESCPFYKPEKISKKVVDSRFESAPFLF